MDSGRVGGQSHWDISLLRSLEEHGPLFGAPHAFPRIGHYQGHPSQSSDTEGWRDSHRAQPRVQETTRREHAFGGRTRTLNGWKGRRGIAVWKADLVLPSRAEDLRWFTCTGAPEGWARNERLIQERLALARPQSTSQGSGPARLRNQLVWGLTAANLDDNPAAETKRRKREHHRGALDYSLRIFAAAGLPVATVRRGKP